MILWIILGIFATSNAAPYRCSYCGESGHGYFGGPAPNYASGASTGPVSVIGPTVGSSEPNRYTGDNGRGWEGQGVGRAPSYYGSQGVSGDSFYSAGPDGSSISTGGPQGTVIRGPKHYVHDSSGFGRY